ncbi:HIT family protein [Candidatus Woesearchaeota archaeon]|nr:HIT family protein [Candidatus Woesearchaeota archaeon]
MKDCLFCKIIRKEIPADIVYEDKSIIAFFDINPANKGHTLVMPKNHSNNLLEDNEDDLKNISLAVKKIGNAIMKATNAEGLNIISNINSVAGQVVFHTHVHIIPRFKDDGINFKVQRRYYDEGESKKLASKIKTLLK